MTCPLCGKPIADTGTVCHACTARTARDLDHIAEHWHDLQITLTRQDRIGDPAKATAEQPLPFNVTASSVADAIRNTLTTWARDIENARGATPPADTPALARWLGDQTAWLRHRDDGGEAIDELGSCWQLLRGAIDRPPPRAYCGPCDTCGADLYATPGRLTVVCRACEVEYDIRARREWLLSVADDTLAHAGLIARALDELGEPVKSERIRQWAARGRLVAKGRDHIGRPLYAVKDVRTLVNAEETRLIESAKRRASRRHHPQHAATS